MLAITANILVVATIFLTILPPNSFAQTYSEPSGKSWTCYAPHAKNGKRVPVYGMNGYAAGFWAIATYNNEGWPMIVFDVSKLRALPMVAIRYTYYHECAHLSLPTRDEIRANCVGLINMRKNNDILPREEAILREVHYSLNVLPRQYGGNGRVFWDATIKCAGPPKRKR